LTCEARAGGKGEKGERKRERSGGRGRGLTVAEEEVVKEGEALGHTPLHLDRVPLDGDLFFDERFEGANGRGSRGCWFRCW
jgi:hypothetical protein